MIDALLKLGLILCGFIGLLELFLRLTWNAKYFQSGIPLFTKTIDVKYPYSNTPSSLALEKEFEIGFSLFSNRLLFMQIETNKYAFRASHATRGGKPSHGVVIFDYKNHQITVKSFFHWSIFWFWSMILILIWGNGATPPELLLVIAVSALIIGFSAWLDYLKCAEIADVVVHLWSRKYVPKEDSLL